MSDGAREGWEADVIRMAEGNHLWLNAFRCVRPTPRFAEEVGREVLKMLNDPENLIVSRTPLIESDRVLILRINKS